MKQASSTHLPPTMLPTSAAQPAFQRRQPPTRRLPTTTTSASHPSLPSSPSPSTTSSLSSSYHTPSAHPFLASSFLLLLLLIAAPLPCAAQQQQQQPPPPSPPLPRVYRVAPALVTWTLDGGGDPALLTAADLANHAVVVTLRIGADPNATAATTDTSGGGGGGGDGPLPPFVPNVFVPPRGSGTVSLAVSPQPEGARRNGRGVAWAVAEAGARGAEGVARFEYVSEWEARLVLGPVRGYMLLDTEVVRVTVNTSLVTRGRTAALAPLLPAGGGGGSGAGGGGAGVTLRFAP
eukprot:Rhum_TRINITY_DN11642_c0_g1::Rhum_TRINITY_DN11642_c0_g1_i1::g.45616::m.45616